MRARRPAAGHFSALLSVLLCCLLVVSPSVSALQGGNGTSASKVDRPTKGAPGENLPNLDEVKRRGPGRTGARPPALSTRKKYRHDGPRGEGQGGERDARGGVGATTLATPGGGGVSSGRSGVHTFLGALAVGVKDPYAGVMLASNFRGVPPPPPNRLTQPSVTISAGGWLSSLGSLLGLVAAQQMPGGVFEGANCEEVWGYAWNPAQPGQAIIVTLYDGAQPVASFLADRYRPDIIQQTGDDGRHGFRFPLPDSLRDGATHTLSVQIQGAGAGTGLPLSSSPRTVMSCSFNYSGAVAADCDRVTGWAWDLSRPSTPIDVDVYVDGAFAARASADTYNAQLNMGDDKRHQFSVPTPLVARDGQSHTVTIRPAGSAQTLGSATTSACAGPNYQGYIDYADCEVIAGWALDHNKLNTPVSVDIYTGSTFVTRVVADNFRQDIANYVNDNGLHGFMVPVPDSLRDGVPHQFTAVASGSSYNLNVIPGSVTCSARAGCSTGQDLASTEFVKDFYQGSLGRQPRPLELQYWNDALRTAAAQGQAALLAKAKLLGRELFLEGEYANRARMTAGQEANYVSDLYWAYLQRGPDASGQGWWVGQITTQNSQGQNGWLNALVAFEGAPEFGARVASLCPSPADSVRSYDPARDFSPLQNPDGAWSYGYRVSAGVAFTRYPAHYAASAFDQGAWYEPAISDPYNLPQVGHGTLSQVVGMHPGPQGQQAVVRWTAPAAGTYLVSGRFENRDNATTDVHVVYNSSVALFDRQVNGVGSTAPFSVTRAVAAGETIDFSVGYGPNGNYYNDSTGLVVTVSRQVSTPYASTSAQVPGRVEVELFDEGGAEVAYHDTTLGPQGHDYTLPSPFPPPAFRQPTDVDLDRHANYSGGYLAQMQAGDWMNYTADVAAEGAYTLQATVAWGGGAGGTFHVEADGADITGPIQIPDTGFTLQTISRPGVWLPAGHHVLRVVADTNGAGGGTGSIDCLTFVGSQPLVPNSAAFVSQSVPARMLAGNNYTASVTFRNTGSKTWTAAGNYRLGSQNPQDNLTWGVARASLAVPVPPGGEGTFTFTVTAPSTAGTYNFQWRMVQDGGEWFGEPGINQQVEVSPLSGVNLALGKAATQASTLTPYNPPGDAWHAVDGNTDGNYFSGSVSHTLGGGKDWWQVDLGGIYALQSVRVWKRTDCCDDQLSNFYVFVSDTPFASTDLAATLAQPGVSAYHTPGQGGRPTTLSAVRTGRYVRVQRATQGILSLAEVEVMGVPADNSGADPTGNNYAAARTDPANTTGGGDDPLSRNANFTVPLVSLKGRAGLDLGLGLSYNSLVWTRDAATASVRFDADDGEPSAGFRMGLPTVGRRYLNARGADAYLLVTPSGARVELQRSAGTNVFLSTDSSYLQMTEGIFGLSLLSTTGTQMTFVPAGAQFVCTRVEDRNGNYITASYDGAGRLTSLTDTLGRVVTVSYDANGRPLAVGQERSGQTHQWATFGYTDLTVNTSFAGVSVNGPANGTVMSVLKWVSLDDGSRHEFLYNSWGQVSRREYHAPDGRLLSYTEYDLQAPTSAQTNNGTDCPRFTQRRDFAKDWNNDVPAVTSYSVDPGGAQVVRNSQTFVNGAGADTPATVMQKITYGGANTFQRGLITSVETWGQTAPGQYALKRTAQMSWTQDDESLTYPLNPRVRVSEVSDPQGNHTGTTIDYTSFGLPDEVREWSVSKTNFGQPVEVMQWNGASVYVLRRTHTEYNLDPAYVSRRVLGLVSSTSVYDEQGHVVAKVDYTYDQGGEFLQHQGEPVQHDGANYGPTFVIGRGLVTSVRRWDVTALHDITKSVESRAGYNTTGAAVFSRDPLGHQSTISYADRFSDKAGTNTLAYPTLATDPDGFSSKVEYNFHTGAMSRTEDPKGAQRTFTYDAAGRTLRVETSGRGATAGQVISGGYTRWVYSDAMDAVQTWSQVDAGMPEVCSISILDGAGRVRATASDLPNSSGGYSAQYTHYDIAGRAAGQTNPTEASGLWKPAGDDALRGWKWTTQTYDWKSRPLVTTLPKLLNPSHSNYNSEPVVTRQAEYGGCGCAGGEAVTLTDEAGRRQIFTSDQLGRQIKSETLNPSGSVYSTVANTYNGLGQVTETRHLVGTNGAAQVTTMTYDGHGRLKTRHLPRYAGNTTTAYEYDADDTLISVTDPRGVVTTYGFTNAANTVTNKRHLVNSVSYSHANGNPPPSVSAPEPVRFEYDGVGNRTSMTDGTGSFAYAYDGLSRLMSETRHFKAPLNKSYTINYGYTLSGQLKLVSEQGGSAVQYSYDPAGRLFAAGTGPTSATSYASNMKYRAWGGLKDVDLGNQTHQFIDYDARLRAATMELRNVIVNPTSQTSLTMTWNYGYNADGRLDHAYDLQDNRFDRKLGYDDHGRLKEAFTGLEARGQAPAEPANSPFRQTFAYDEWGNMTGREGRLWKHELPGVSSPYGTDDQHDGWTYDATGNLTESDSHADEYDAAGNQIFSHPPAVGDCSGYDYEIMQQYDGAGRPAHRVQTKRTNVSADPAQVQCVTAVDETYYVYSTALGGAKLLELSPSGDKVKGYVYGGGRLLAKQEFYLASGGSAVKWRHDNPGSTSWVETNSNRVFERQEMDPLGAEVGTVDPVIITATSYTDVHADAPMFVDGGDPFHLSDGCGDIDGMPASCAEISERTENRTAVYEEWGGRFRAVPRPSPEGKCQIRSGWTAGRTARGRAWTRCVSATWGTSGAVRPRALVLFRRAPCRNRSPTRSVSCQARVWQLLSQHTTTHSRS